MAEKASSALWRGPALVAGSGRCGKVAAEVAERDSVPRCGEQMLGGRRKRQIGVKSSEKAPFTMRTYSPLRS
jgi:hypothetical protein